MVHYRWHKVQLNISPSVFRPVPNLIAPPPPPMIVVKGTGIVLLYSILNFLVNCVIYDVKSFCLQFFLFFQKLGDSFSEAGRASLRKNTLNPYNESPINTWVEKPEVHKVAQ